jgi:hypothetical protein
MGQIPEKLRMSDRGKDEPGNRNNDMGFRCVGHNRELASGHYCMVRMAGASQLSSLANKTLIKI